MDQIPLLMLKFKLRASKLTKHKSGPLPLSPLHIHINSHRGDGYRSPSNAFEQKHKCVDMSKIGCVDTAKKGLVDTLRKGRVDTLKKGCVDTTKDGCVDTAICRGVDTAKKNCVDTANSSN